MKVLVTGATGLLGSTIVKKLLATNYSVHCLCRSTSDRSLLNDVSEQVTWEEGDVLDMFSLEQAISKVDMVVHTAAMVSFVPREQKKMFTVNVEGTANVVNACLHVGVQKLCHISSVAALGRPTSHEVNTQDIVVINETQRWTDSTSNSNYAKTKYHSELEVWRGISEGLKAVIVNPSIILGDGDWNKSSTRLFKYVYDENLFYSEGLLNYVDAKDVAIAVSALLNTDIINRRFVLNGGTIQYKEFFNKAATSMNKRPPRRKVNSFLAGIVWRIEAIRSYLFGSSPLLTKETARAALHRFQFDGSLITRTIPFKYTTIDDTVMRIGRKISTKY